MCFGLFLCFFYRTAADYYDVVTTPIDLLKIQQKLKTDEYDDIDLLTNDVRLMINNAKAYYKVCACFSSCSFALFFIGMEKREKCNRGRAFPFLWGWLKCGLFCSYLCRCLLISVLFV